jgi:hypothetical protein
MRYAQRIRWRGATSSCAFTAPPRNRAARTAIDLMLRHRNLFDDQRFCFFGISIDPADETECRVQDDLPGVRFLWGLRYGF